MLNLKKIILLLLSVASLTLAGCATAPYQIQITKEGQQKLGATSVVIGLSQEEIYADFTVADSSGATSQYGFLGALIGSLIDSGINSSRSEDAENTVAPIRDALVGYDFGSNFQKNLSFELRKIGWLNSKEIYQDYSLDNVKISELINSASADSVLTVETKYYMSQDLKSLTVNATVTLHPSKEALRVYAKSINPSYEKPLLYRNRISHKHVLPVDAANAEEAGQAWSNNNGEAIKEGMEQSIAKLVKLIADDLQLTPQLEKPNEPTIADLSS